MRAKRFALAVFLAALMVLVTFSALATGSSGIARPVTAKPADKVCLMCWD